LLERQGNFTGICLGEYSFFKIQRVAFFGDFFRPARVL
jgi:hypothetical protein